MSERDSKRVVLAMSGGVDSAVACLLLQKEGYDVNAAYFIMSDAHLAGEERARQVSCSLGVPLDVLDLRERFDNLVAKPFCEEYCAGRTPNPCVRCNPSVKFAALSEHADFLGISAISSGHYARLDSMNGHTVLRRAVCAQRDQSYMLCRLSQDILSRLVLPLGELDKDTVRKTAREAGLCNADAPDSQEICFIPQGDYASYIRSRGFHGKSGFLISPDGERLAPSNGAERYTVGQRRGLGVTLGKPLYVKRICENGDVLLAWADDVYATCVTATQALFSDAFELHVGDVLSAKPRSAAKPLDCRIASLTENSFTVSFDEPVRAAAPGQEMVLYDGEFVVCCATIAFVE